MTTTDLIQSFIDADYEHLLSVANGALAVVFPKLRQAYPDIDEAADPDEIMLMFLATTIASDGYFTEPEYKFFCDLTGVTLSYAEVGKYIAAHLNEESKKAADFLFDNIVTDVEGKKALFLLCLAICAVDKSIPVEEISFIRRMLEVE